MRALHLKSPSVVAFSASTSEPSPSPNQYLVRVHAAAITSDELTWTETLSRPSPIPAHDVYGTVVSTPSSILTPTYSVGDEIIALTSFSRDGAAAEYVVVEEDELTRKPKSLSSIEAAAVPLSFLTAWQALLTHAQATSSQSILILGASGGVGVIAVQLARWLDMNRIAGTCSARNSEFVRGLGAQEIFDYSSEKVEGIFDIVLDCVGGQGRDECSQNVKEGGTLVSVAAPIPEELKKKMKKGVKSVFFIVEPNGTQLAEACGLIDQGRLKPVIDHVYPLEDGVEAFAELSKRHTRGKIVLKI